MEKSSALDVRSSSGNVNVLEPISSSTKSETLMLSVADSLAKILASLESEKDSTEQRAGCGLSSSALFPSLCRPGYSLKTCPRFSMRDYPSFSTASMRSGMTVNGTLYQLPPLVPDITATVSGLLPTPAARDWKDTAGMAKEKGKRSRIDQLHRRIYFDERSSSGKVNPEYVEWLMGFPITWTESTVSATPSSRKSPKSSDEPL